MCQLHVAAHELLGVSGASPRFRLASRKSPMSLLNAQRAASF
jgi:hypothetical protein